MSFVMIATGARVRTVSRRSIVVGVLAAALLMLGTGAGLGYWAARPGEAAPLPRAERPAWMPLALEQIGALSARLFQLETQAEQLSRRLGLAPARAAPAAPAPSAPAPSAPAHSGGPMLPPRSDTAEPAQALLLDEQAETAALQQRLHALEQQLAAVSDADLAQALRQMRLPTRAPVAGADVVSAFGNRQDPITGRRAFHAGLDFAAEHGAPIRAAAGGVVRFAGFHPEYGWTIEVDHGNGLATRYAHASKLLAGVGAVVAPGDLIARVGSSGRSTGPHLHFEVLRGGATVDPRLYLARR